MPFFLRHVPHSVHRVPGHHLFSLKKRGFRVILKRDNNGECYKRIDEVLFRMRIRRVLPVILILISIVNSGMPFLTSVQGDSPEFIPVGEYDHPDFWTPDHGVTFNHSHSKNFAAVLDHQGNTHMVWEDLRSNQSDVYYVQLDNRDGQKLINDFKVSHSQGMVANPTVAVDRPNRIYIMWQEHIDGDWNIYFSELRYDEEDILLYRDRVYVDTINTTYPVNFDIEMRDHETIHMILEDIDSGVQNIYYKSFSTIYYSVMGTIQITDTPGNSSAPYLVKASNGDLHLMWMDEEGENNGLYYKKFDERVQNIIPKRRLTVTDRSTRFDFTMDNRGDLHVVFDDNRYHDHKRDIIYTKLDDIGRTLIDDRLISPRENNKDSFSPGITVNHVNEIYIVWSDGRDYSYTGEGEYNISDAPLDIYIQRMDGNVSFLGDAVRLTGNMSRSIDPVVLTDTNNQQHILWVDDMGGYYNIYYKRTEKSDLVLESASIYPETPVIYDNYTTYWKIYNQGLFKANTTFHIFRIQDDRVELVKRFQVYVPAEDYTKIELNVTATEAGNNRYLGLVNKDREVDEPSYNNNLKPLEYFVIDPSVTIKPLRYTSDVLPGEKAEFEYIIKNIGNVKQDISLQVNSTDDLDITRDEIYTIESGENKTGNISIDITTSKPSGEYSLNMSVRSLIHENFYDRYIFTFTIEPLIDFQITSDLVEVDDLESIDHSTNLTVRNTGNVELYVWVLLMSDKFDIVGELSPDGLILLPGESDRVELDFNRTIDDTKDSTITVVAQADDITRTIDINIIGEEEVEKTSWLDAVPWFWIILILGLVVGAFISMRILNTMVFTEEEEE